MTPDEIRQKEKELQERADALDARAAELSKQAADAETKGKNIDTNSSTPSPSSYATSIKLHVPITLDLTASNYTNRRELFLVALGRYGLTTHVVGDAGATPSDTSATSDWGCDDYTVLSWIYGSISTALFGMTTSDETRVLTLPRGLNDSFAHLRSFLPFQVPFPSFLQTRSALILEETQKKTDAKNAASTALWASGNSVLPNAGVERAPPAGYGGGRSSGGFNNNFNFNHGGGRGRGCGRGRRGRGRDNHWQFNPWTGAPTRANPLHQQAPWQQQPSGPSPATSVARFSTSPPQTFGNPMQPPSSSTASTAVDPALLAAR